MADGVEYGDVLVEFEDDYVATAEIRRPPNNFMDVALIDSLAEAFADADVVYPKSWAPYEIMLRRTELASRDDAEGLQELERECLATNARFIEWECNEERMKLTNGRRALYMHCLPADISGVSCTTGEVSRDLFERCRLDTYLEASYKPFVIAAMIFLAKIGNPAESLLRLAQRNQQRCPLPPVEGIADGEDHELGEDRQGEDCVAHDEYDVPGWHSPHAWLAPRQHLAHVPQRRVSKHKQ